MDVLDLVAGLHFIPTPLVARREPYLGQQRAPMDLPEALNSADEIERSSHRQEFYDTVDGKLTEQHGGSLGAELQAAQAKSDLWK